MGAKVLPEPVWPDGTDDVEYIDDSISNRFRYNDDSSGAADTPLKLSECDLYPLGPSHDGAASKPRAPTETEETRPFESAPGKPRIVSESVHPLEHSFEEQCEMHFEKILPQSVYSVAVLSMLQGTDKFEMAAGFMYWICVWVCVASQICFIGHIAILQKEISPHECPTSFYLRSAALIAHFLTTSADLQETAGMINWVTKFPVSQKIERLRFIETRICMGDGTQATIMAKNVQLASGMTKWYKVIVMVVIVLPKLGVAISLIHFGLLYLLASEANDDLILNATALSFVTTIPYLTYCFFVPFAIRDVVENFPDLPDQEEVQHGNEYSLQQQNLGRDRESTQHQQKKKAPSRGLLIWYRVTSAFVPLIRAVFLFPVVALYMHFGCIDGEQGIDELW